MSLRLIFDISLITALRTLALFVSLSALKSWETLIFLISTTFLLSLDSTVTATLTCLPSFSKENSVGVDSVSAASTIPPISIGAGCSDGSAAPISDTKSSAAASGISRSISMPSSTASSSEPKISISSPSGAPSSSSNNSFSIRALIRGATASIILFVAFCSAISLSFFASSSASLNNLLI